MFHFNCRRWPLSSVFSYGTGHESEPIHPGRVFRPLWVRVSQLNTTLCGARAHVQRSGRAGLLHVWHRQHINNVLLPTCVHMNAAGCVHPRLHSCRCACARFACVHTVGKDSFILLKGLAHMHGHKWSTRALRNLKKRFCVRLCSLF